MSLWVVVVVVVVVDVNSCLLVHHLDLGRRVELASVTDVRLYGKGRAGGALLAVSRSLKMYQNTDSTLLVHPRLISDL